MSLILSGTNGLSDVDGTAATPAVRGTDTNTGIFFPAADTVAASVGGTEGLRLTTTGLGVGTSSPSFLLHASTSSAAGTVTSGVRNTAADGNTRFALGNNAGTARATISLNNNSDEKMTIGPEGSFPMLFQTNGSERMRLDSSGNLGLGVTPSAWRTDVSFKALQMPGGSFTAYMAGGVDQTPGIAANGYVDAGGTWRYINSRAASWYIQNGGMHIWYNAASGTAGNAISFTQAMTLDASGNLLVGTTSAPANWNTVSPKMRAAGGIQIGDYCLVCEDAFDTDSLCLVSDSTENICFGNYNRSTLVYTERARITVGGDLLVGGSSGDPNPGVFIYKSGAVSQGNSAGASGFEFLSFRRSGTQIGTVTQNGTTAVAYNTSSDYRLKHDIAPMTGALAKVALLKPCTYKWNADNSAGEGFIAHELAEVCPQAVTGEKDAVDSDGNPKYQGIDTSFLVATLTAAIQEQQAIIESLTARITALEAK